MRLALLSLAAVGLVAMPVLAQAGQENTKKSQRRVCIDSPDTGSNMRRARTCRMVEDKDAERRQNQLQMDLQRSAPRGYNSDLPAVGGPK